MNPLRRHLEGYLALRRLLGFKLHNVGCELHKFVRFAQEANASFLTTKLAMQWATQSTRCQPAYWTVRLGMVRRFAGYPERSGSANRTAATGTAASSLPSQKSLIFYSDREVFQLIRAAQKIPSPKGLRAATCSTLFGLLAATGMRLGEALALDRSDADLDQGRLHVHQAKFNKSRWVPLLHPSTQGKLQDYRHLRDRIFPHPQSPSSRYRSKAPA